MVSIELKNGDQHQVQQQEIALLQAEFPAVDVLAEIMAMASWCRNNPTRRKTERGVRRFISAWLGRAKERSPGAKPVYAAAHKKFQAEDLRTSEEDKKRANAQLERYAAMIEKRR